MKEDDQFAYDGIRAVLLNMKEQRETSAPYPFDRSMAYESSVT
jgi:hypothetical protein